MNRKVIAIYVAALLQGIVMVAFPAASAIFTNPNGFGFSNTEYGSLFIPQAVLSILFSLLSFKIGEKTSLKNVLLIGLFANILSMALLFTSATLLHQHLLAYCIILLATGCLGIGFGLTVPCLNTFASLFFPKKIDTAILVLNALLGLGTALAPLLIALFINIWSWWGLPLTLSLLLIALLLFTLPLPLTNGGETSSSDQRAFYSMTFWLFALFAFLYGILETANGNWAVVYMTRTIKADAATASMALAAFWGMVTFGRILFALVGRILPKRIVFKVLPFVIAGAFLFVSQLEMHAVYMGIFGFGLAGLGCSALLPLCISFGTAALPSIRTAVAGCLVAFYLMGYGVAAFAAGALQDLIGINLSAFFMICSGVALFLGLIIRPA